MGLMVKYFFLVLQVCAIASTLVLEVSSGQTISPSASFSGAPPINEGQIISNSPGPTSQPNDPPHFESPNQPPPNAGGPIISIPESSPPSPPAVPPTVPVSVPPIPQPEKGPDSKSPVSPPTMSVQMAPPPQDMLQNPPPVAQVPPSSPQSPPIILPGPMASPPNKLPEASPPTNPTLPITPPNLPLPVDLPPSSPPTLPPSPPILPVPVDLPPSTLPSSPPTLPLPSPNLPAPSASPPSTLPINSPPTPPISTIPPPNSPAPMASPPITLPRNSPPTPPISAIPPPNSPVPIASPSPPSPVASSPPPSSAASPPPPPSVASSPPPPSVASSPLPSSVASPPPPSVASSPPPSPVASSSPPPSNLPGPVALPPRNLPGNLQPIHHNSSIPPPNLPVSPISTPIPRDISPVSSPPNRTTNITPPPHSPVKAPVVHHAPPPHSGYKSPPTKSHPPPSLPPLYPPPPPGPASRPMHHRLPPPPPGPASKPSHHTPPPPSLDSAVPPIENSISPSFSPSTTPPPVHSTMPILSPKVSPSRSPPMIPKPFQALPPPPPNEDCSSIVCVDPLTNTPPGTPCKCVLPMQVELRLSISLYTFFPLVSELAFEMASGLFLKSSQVRIMGANEDNQDQEKTIAIINLVPLGEIFENYTAYVVAQRLWMKQVPIKSSLFGDYEVLFVKYPGLPPSPPLPSSSYNGEPYGHGNNGRDVKPLGVDVSKQRHSNKLNSGLIAIIAFSVVVAVVLVGVVVWVLVFKDRNRAQSGSNPPATLPSVTKSSGVGASIGSGPESNSLSFRSSIAYTGSAKTFSSSEMEKATDNFNESGVLGEGGFGRVYNGVLEDGTKVAVKVLKQKMRFLLFLLLLTSSSSLIAFSQTIVKTLPGYPGPLPFKLETGYIGVGEDEAVQLFYYFVESEGNPEEDPLIIWLAGGPGCGTLRAFFYEIGPMQIQYGNYMDNVPALQLDPNSWTKVANVIYLDAPTLTGYSYTKTPEAVRSSDTLSASQTAEFLRKFVKTHPKFLKNPMYVTGISYSGIVIPIITEELYKGNDEGLEPIVNIQGYMGGNPLTDKTGDINSRLEYAYRVALISEELFESTKRSCKGDYAEADSNNLQCMLDIDEVNKRVGDINIQQILDPDCDPATNLVRGGNPIIRRGNRKSVQANPIKMLPERSSFADSFCRGDYYNYATLWANDENVMRALNVREGTVKEWLLCNLDMKYNYGKPSMPSYEFNIQSSIVYHEKLSKRNCRALIFSGDHDMMVPHVGTRNWINSINLTITDSNWDAWYANGQSAGYKTSYAHDNYTLVFATVKGAGHTAPEFKPAECFEMVKRWFAHRPI